MSPARHAALVDVDGTLVDSNYHHAIAWSRALRDHGHDARLAAIHRLIGMGGAELVESLIGHPDQGVEDSWRHHFDGLLPEVVPFERAADLLRGLKEAGLIVVLATSSPPDLLEELRARLDADEAIDVIVTSGDVEDAKPAPDIFEVAAEKAEVPVGRAVALGDSVWDVKAAGRAGVRCVGLESGGFSHFELLDAGAERVYEAPGDLLADLSESPFGRAAQP